MNQNYKIEVGVTPHTHDNKNQPFHWTLFAYCEEWCNEGSGWARTPELAWKEAYNFYARYKKQQNIPFLRKGV